MAQEIFTDDYLYDRLPLGEGPVRVGELISLIRSFGLYIPADARKWWEQELGLSEFNEGRVATRLEAAVLVDKTVDPFNMFGVNYNGDLR